MSQLELFNTGAELPDGFIYAAEFISRAEEQQLIEKIERLEFGELKMRGVVAKRRTAHFGWSYEFETFKLGDAPPIPEFLLPLRERIAQLAHRPAAEFAEVLVTEYSPGAGIGWHRDVPPFDIVAGVSLLSECTMQFRPWPSDQREGSAVRKRVGTFRQQLAPRSAYLLRGAARSEWQHHIPPMHSLRYSITFRTLRERT